MNLSSLKWQLEAFAHSANVFKAFTRDSDNSKTFISDAYVSKAFAHSADVSGSLFIDVTDNETVM